MVCMRGRSTFVLRKYCYDEPVIRVADIFDILHLQPLNGLTLIVDKQKSEAYIMWMLKEMTKFFNYKRNLYSSK